MTQLDDDKFKRLAEKCIFENARFQREGKSDSTICFDLLRHALAELNPIALEYVYAIYLPKLERWAAWYVGQHDYSENSEYFATEAFDRFYFKAIGDQFDEKFEALAQVIRFMQVCLFNVIRGDHRKNRNLTESLPDEPTIPDPNRISDLSNESALWQHICSLLPNPKHQLLARLVFILDMKPREIIAIPKYKKLWKTERNVSMTLYRIRLVLRADDELRNWLDDQSEI